MEKVIYNVAYNIVAGIIDSYDDVDDVIDCLKVWFDDVRFIDEKIDDGCDEGEDDTYVMMRSYDIKKGNDMFYLRLYYGDCTMTVGSFDLKEYE